MPNVTTFPRVFATASLLALAAVPVAAPAASQCSGIQQDACQARAECSWVEAYERKDGRSVSSHCKSKARRKPADQAALDSRGAGKFD